MALGACGSVGLAARRPARPPADLSEGLHRYFFRPTIRNRRHFLSPCCENALEFRQIDDIRWFDFEFATVSRRLKSPTHLTLRITPGQRGAEKSFAAAGFHSGTTAPLQPPTIVDLPEFAGKNPTTTHSQPGKEGKVERPHASKPREIDKFPRLLEQQRIREGCAACISPGREYERCREGLLKRLRGIISF